MPRNTVNVARPGPWGNPWTAANSGGVHPALRYACETAPFFVLKIRAELRGKNLACWCKKGEPCHGDVLLAIANA